MTLGTGVFGVVATENFNFNPTVRPLTGQITANGQIIIGSAVAPNVRVGIPTAVAGGGMQVNTGPGTLGFRMASPYVLSDFSFESNTSGETRTLTVQNTVDGASSAAVMNIQVAGASSNNPYLNWTRAGQRLYQMQVENGVDTTFFFGRSATGNSTTIAESIFRVDQPDSQARLWVQARGGIVVGGTGAFSGGNALAHIINSDTAANSNAKLLIQVSPTSGGNAFVQYGGPPQNWSHGVNKTGASGAWQLMNVGTFPTGSAVISATPAGEVTMALQPSFFAYLNPTVTNVTGNGTAYTVAWNAEIYDKNADFNTGTGTFTAPVTGIYSFYVALALLQVGSAHNDAIGYILTSNRQYVICNEDVGALIVGAADPSNVVVNGSCQADMDAGDTATVVIDVAGSTLTVDVGGGASLGSFFTGSLIN